MHLSIPLILLTSSSSASTASLVAAARTTATTGVAEDHTYNSIKDDSIVSGSDTNKQEKNYGIITLFSKFRQGGNKYRSKRYKNRNNNKGAAAIHGENVPPAGPIKPLWWEQEEKKKKKNKKENSKSSSVLRRKNDDDDNDDNSLSLKSLKKNNTTNTATTNTNACDTGIVASCRNKGEICHNGFCVLVSTLQQQSQHRILSHYYTNNCVNIASEYPYRTCDCSNITSSTPLSGTIECTEQDDYCTIPTNPNTCSTITIRRIFTYGTNGSFNADITALIVRGSDSIQVEYNQPGFYTNSTVTSVKVDECNCNFTEAVCPEETRSSITRLTCPGLPTIDTCTESRIDDFLNFDPICGTTNTPAPTNAPTLRPTTRPTNSPTPVPVLAPVSPPTSSPNNDVSPTTPTTPTPPTGLAPTPLQPIIGPITVPTADPPSTPCLLGFICVCFSASNLVQVQGKGLIQMNELQIGDFVMVSSQDTNEKMYNPNEHKSMYSRVISFTHKDETSYGLFLQIYTKKIGTSSIENIFDNITNTTTTTTIQPIEISHDHMIQKSDTTTYVRASDIQIGDILPDGMLVVNIQTIYSRGLYAPVTETGTIIVSGITASSYVAILHRIPAWIQHYIAHALYAPIRLYNLYLSSLHDTMEYNDHEVYTDDGYSDNYVMEIVKLAFQLREYPVYIQIMVTILLIPFVVSILIMEQVLMSFFTQEYFYTFFIVCCVMLLWNPLLSLSSKRKKKRKEERIGQ